MKLFRLLRNPQSAELLIAWAWDTARQVSNCWLPAQSAEHLFAIREAEINCVLPLLPPSGRVLEVGAGTGSQAVALVRAGYKVEAIDIPASQYAPVRVFPVKDFDGHTIPFEDASFDVIYSSNVLEHVAHLERFQDELHRVLRPNGFAIHVLPTPTWRLWTTLTEVIRFWYLPQPHGEHARDWVDELRCFGRGWWQRMFRRTGWRVVEYHTNRLFYTGASVMDRRLGLSVRRILAQLLGHSCHLFVLTPARSSTQPDDTSDSDLYSSTPPRK